MMDFILSLVFIIILAVIMTNACTYENNFIVYFFSIVGLIIVFFTALDTNENTKEETNEKTKEETKEEIYNKENKTNHDTLILNSNEYFFSYFY